MSSTLSRRSVLKGIIAGTVTMGIPMRFSDFALNTNEKESGTDVLKGILIIPLRVGVSMI
jgi:hydroxypyruvate isomerase